MFDKKLLDKLKEKYSDLHPLLFSRSKERARSNGDLFDILDTVPEMPVTWCDQSSRWVHVDDLFFMEIAKEL
jgi:hypothetical protein